MSALMTPRDTAAAPVRDDSGQDGVPSAAAPRLAGAWPRLRRHAPIAVPAALLVLLLVASLLAPWLPVDDPTQIEQIGRAHV